MYMSNSLRRIYNIADSLFDTRAITKEARTSHDLGKPHLPKTALQTFRIVQPFAYDLDRNARLKMIVSQQGVIANGTSSYWEFFFDLVQRQAKLVCQWVLSWDDTTDDFGPARLEIFVNPFPPVDSPIRQAVREGRLLYQQMLGMWKQECKRCPDLPSTFRDTNLVLTDFMRQGLDMTQEEFSLSTGQSQNGDLCWMAQTRNATYYSVFG